MSGSMQLMAAAFAAAAGGGNQTPTLLQYWLKNWQTGTPASLQTGSNPMTVTAGTTLVAVTVGYDSTRQIPILTDNAGTFAVPTDGTNSALIHSSTFETVHISTQPNAAGGSHTISIPTINDGSGGTNGELGVWIYQVPNMRATQLVRDVGLDHNINATKPWTVSSRTTTPAVGDFVLGVGVYENSAAQVNAGMSNPPSGWTALNVNNDATNFLPTTIFWRTVSSAGTQSASITCTDPNKTEDFGILVALVP